MFLHTQGNDHRPRTDDGGLWSAVASLWWAVVCLPSVVGGRLYRVIGVDLQGHLEKTCFFLGGSLDLDAFHVEELSRVFNPVEEVLRFFPISRP